MMAGIHSLAFPKSLTHIFATLVPYDRSMPNPGPLLFNFILAMLGLVMAAGVVNISTSPRPFPQFITVCVLLLWLMVHLLLFRQGYARLASLLFPLTAWFVITGLVLFSGGINSPNLDGYIPLTLGVALVLGLRYGIVIAIMSILAGLGIQFAQTHDMLPEQLLVYRPINVWVIHTIWLTATAIMVYLATRNLTTALRSSIRNAHRQSSVAKQQAAIARLGYTALETNELSGLFNLAVMYLAETLNVECCHLLELLPGGDELLLRACAGSKQELVGKATVENDKHSLTGYALLQDAPVIVADARREDRFTVPSLLCDCKVVSCMSRTIRLRRKPFGILNVYTNHRRCFTENEIYFLEAIANILSTAVERYHVGDALRESEKLLRQAQKMEAIGHLAGGIAHDFNNVLAQISAAAELLETRAGEKSLQRYLDVIYGSVARGESVTRRILSFSQDAEPLNECLSLQNLLDDICHIIKHTFPKNITVKLKEYHDKDLIWGDKTQLHQVFLNLCLNAADAMPEGGKLTLSLHRPRTREVRRYITNPESDYVSILISDTGVGMDPATAEKVFDPFFSTKTPGKGIGLGLSIAYKIIAEHHGWIDLESTPGVGTTFTVGLPVTDRKPEAETVKAQKGAAPGEEKHILVVEDEPAFQTLLQEILSLKDYTISLAGNGVEALKFFHDHDGKIDLVITDLGMPEMDGLELIRKLHAADPKVKIIVSSGYPNIKDFAQLKECGVLKVLNKPYKLNEVIQGVEAALGRPPGRYPKR